MGRLRQAALRRSGTRSALPGSLHASSRHFESPPAIGGRQQRDVSLERLRPPGEEPHETLSPQEFLRRFLLHVLPKGFPRIRYFGWMANRRRAGLLLLCRSLPALQLAPQIAAPAALSAAPAEWQCPHCLGSRHQTERLTQAQILFERMVVIADSS